MKTKKTAKPQKHSAMKLPPLKSASAQGPGGPAGGSSWQSQGGKPHKTPEHLMGKARKVH